MDCGSAQRLSAEKLCLAAVRARAGRHPDPFGQPLWTLIQVLLWVSFRNRDLVRDASPPEPFESTFTIMDLRDLARNGAIRKSRIREKR